MMVVLQRLFVMSSENASPARIETSLNILLKQLEMESLASPTMSAALQPQLRSE